MLEEELTLEELSERTGVEPRTLRSWVSEGLLSPPLRQGRGARYPATNVDRALAVRALKDLHGMSLSEIGRRFLMATDEQIRAWAKEGGPVMSSPGSARDYLNRIRDRTPKKKPKFGLSERRSMAPDASSKPELFPERDLFEPSRRISRRPDAGDWGEELASLERLILQLEQVLDAPAPRRSRGAIWTRISITPDLELSVRGDLEPRERLLFEQLADQFRAILTGRPKNE